MITDAMKAGVLTMRPFLPARDYALSQAFYRALGFEMAPLSPTLSVMRLGANEFLLQEFYVKDFAENLAMHMLVDDLDAWWRHIESLDLAQRFGVQAPRAPKLEPWGLRVAYVFDPAGVLWHFAART